LTPKFGRAKITKLRESPEHDMSDTENIPADTLTDLAASAFEKAGLPPSDARVTADHLILMDLMGVSTHGVHRIEQYVKRINAGVVDPQADITIDDRAPTIAVVDGANGQGQVISQKALDIAMTKARENAIAFVTVRNSGHFGGTASYGYLAAQAGLVLLSGTGASPSMAPFGGRDLLMGNNPFGCSAPGSLRNPKQLDPPPFILDMAQSVAARGKMRKLRDAGDPMPLGWALDKDGNPTTDPQAGLDGFIQFMGGHKGYGLSLMVDMLSGLLSGGRYLDQTGQMWDEDGPQGTCHFFIAIDPGKLLNPTDYDTRIADFRSRIKSSAPFTEDGTVFLPGEIEMNNLKERQENGIPVPAATLAKVREIAE
jgi:LDH2 family malate/lactate/ureidoglycolate dehydrogenase